MLGIVAASRRSDRLRWRGLRTRILDAGAGDCPLESRIVSARARLPVAGLTRTLRNRSSSDRPLACRVPRSAVGEEGRRRCALRVTPRNAACSTRAGRGRWRGKCSGSVVPPDSRAQRAPARPRRLRRNWLASVWLAEPGVSIRKELASLPVVGGPGPRCGASCLPRRPRLAPLLRVRLTQGTQSVRTAKRSARSRDVRSSARARRFSRKPR